MSLNLQLPTEQHAMRPVITVVGVGGAGGNAVNNMISAQLEGVQFVVANTDAQALDSSLTERSIQLGRNITQGLGAGATPEIGMAAAEEAAADIAACIDGSNMVFITAGMGGGTGTGAAPVVARMAREAGMLTVGVVTKPFQFEGGKRMKIAEYGLSELQKYVDTLIVIPNQNLFRIANEKTTFADAFRMADEVLHSGVRGVTDLMVKPGLVNLDFADIRTVMQEMGKAMMGTGEASGEKRAIEAAEAAISNPLLDDVSLKGARAALINITGGADMTLYEVDEAANRIREEIDSDANIIFGSTFNEAMQGEMRVSVVATGIDVQEAEDGQRGTGAQFGAAGQKSSTKKPSPNYYSSKKASAAAPVARPSSSAAGAANNNSAARPVARNTQSNYAPTPQRNTATGDRFAFNEEADDMAIDTQDRHNDDARHGAQERGLFDSDQQTQRQERRPLFSPAGATPSREPHEESFDDAQQATASAVSSSFGLLGRIAEAGRSRVARDDVQPQQQRSNVAVKERVAHQDAEQDSYESGETEGDNTGGDDDNYYDIPAFLRRQAQ